MPWSANKLTSPPEVISLSAAWIRDDPAPSARRTISPVADRATPAPLKAGPSTAKLPPATREMGLVPPRVVIPLVVKPPDELTNMPPVFVVARNVPRLTERVFLTDPKTPIPVAAVKFNCPPVEKSTTAVSAGSLSVIDPAWAVTTMSPAPEEVTRATPIFREATSDTEPSAVSIRERAPMAKLPSATTMVI